MQTFGSKGKEVIDPFIKLFEEDLISIDGRQSLALFIQGESGFIFSHESLAKQSLVRKSDIYIFFFTVKNFQS